MNYNSVNDEDMFFLEEYIFCLDEFVIFSAYTVLYNGRVCGDHNCLLYEEQPNFNLWDDYLPL